jgi:hypothetical protein
LIFWLSLAVEVEAVFTAAVAELEVIELQLELLEAEEAQKAL